MDGVVTTLRGIIVDDIQPNAAILKTYLEKTGRITIDHIFTTAASVLMAASVPPADFWIIDVRLDDGERGVRVARHVRKQTPNLPILFLTAHFDSDFIREFSQDNFMNARHYGIVLRDHMLTPDQLEPIVRQIITERRPSIAYEVYLAREHYRGSNNYRPRARLNDDMLYTIFEANAHGLTNDQICARLNIATRTLENRLTILYESLHLNDAPTTETPRSHTAADYRRRAAIMYYVDRLIEWDADGNMWTYDHEGNRVVYADFQRDSQNARDHARVESQLRQI